MPGTGGSGATLDHEPSADDTGTETRTDAGTGAGTDARAAGATAAAARRSAVKPHHAQSSALPRRERRATSVALDS